jgi:hypothetical protein
MPPLRNLTIVTHWTAADDTQMCNGRLTCPGVHTVADRPDLVYVICAAEIRGLAGGRLVGAVPTQIHLTGRVTGDRVTDPAELSAFADRMAPGEVLLTVPLADWAGAVPVGAAACELSAFADRMAPGEVLLTGPDADWAGAVPVGAAA